MNKTLLLFKTMFRSEDVLEVSMERAGKVKGVFKVLGLFVILLLVGTSFAPIVAELYPALAGAGMEDLLLRLLLFGASVMILFFAFFYIMSVFYFSSDIENYLYLPVKPGSIVLAKFFVVAFYEVVSTLAIFFPSFVLFGYLDGRGAGYYLKALLTLVILPAAPLTLMAILCMLLMRFSKLFRNKDRFTTLSSLFAIVIAVSFSSIMQRFSSAAAGNIPALLQNQGPLFNLLSLIFPAVTLMNRAILGGLTDFLLYTALTLMISGLFLLIFYQVGNALYIDGAKGLKESGMKRRNLSQKELSASIKRSGTLLAIAQKEFKTLVRTPPYFLNCILMTLILPLFFLFPLLFGEGLGELSRLLNSSELQEFRATLDSGLIVAGIMALMAFYAGLNLIAATAITREGANFSFMKYIPVSYRTQLLAKIMPGMGVALAGVLILLVPLIVILQPSALAVAAGLILGALLALFLNLVMIILDVVKPILTWTSEQKAVKQNFNAMVSSMLSMVAGAVPIALYFIVPFDKTWLFLLFLVILVPVNVLLITRLERIAEKSFANKP